jgi:hypothetical protein
MWVPSADSGTVNDPNNILVIIVPNKTAGFINPNGHNGTPSCWPNDTINILLPFALTLPSTDSDDFSCCLVITTSLGLA